MSGKVQLPLAHLLIILPFSTFGYTAASQPLPGVYQIGEV